MQRHIARSVLTTIIPKSSTNILSASMCAGSRIPSMGTTSSASTSSSFGQMPSMNNLNSTTTTTTNTLSNKNSLNSIKSISSFRNASTGIFGTVLGDVDDDGL
eukprot:TRINITY_DN1281_c0_g1_i1.p1 TRINITY_DN1281_c0_g1~~TRINITY_DN1281_c0_g1_i1.p1  ORF type:complete len:120 (-),score=17.12 TRINITY_DN1281_c0_g1_i1:139-447(-)